MESEKEMSDDEHKIFRKWKLIWIVVFIVEIVGEVSTRDHWVVSEIISKCVEFVILVALIVFTILVFKGQTQYGGLCLVLINCKIVLWMVFIIISSIHILEHHDDDAHELDMVVLMHKEGSFALFCLLLNTVIGSVHIQKERNRFLLKVSTITIVLILIAITFAVNISLVNP